MGRSCRGYDFEKLNNRCTDGGRNSKTWKKAASNIDLTAFFSSQGLRFVLTFISPSSLGQLSSDIA